MITKQQVIKNLDDDGLTITLLLTEQCNFECRHCFYSCGPNSPKGYMSQDILTEVLDQITIIGDELEYPNVRINLIGGEPTLNMVKFQGILKRVFGWLEKEFISNIEMTTNGWWLHDLEDTIKFLQVIADTIPEDYLGTDGGFTIRVSNDKWHSEFRPDHWKNRYDEYQTGDRLMCALSLVWDDNLLHGWHSQCDTCETAFEPCTFDDGDDCPVKGCGETIRDEEFCHTSYALPNPDGSQAAGNWIYVEEYNQDRGTIVPLGRGEGIGSNDKCRHGCKAAHGGNLCYKPNGTLHDICSSGSIFPAGTVHDDPFALLAMATDFGEQQTSCYGCHEAAKVWIEENSHRYLEVQDG